MKYVMAMLAGVMMLTKVYGGGDMHITDKKLVKTVTVNCTKDAVWHKWTTHEGLKTFFGENNKIELRPGGAFEIYFSMQAEEGMRGSEGCKVLSYIPGEMFSFTWNAPPMYMKARNSGYNPWVVVQLEEVNKGQTTVVLTHTGWPDDEEWDKVYNYFDAAWNKVMEWLGESCSK